MLSLLIQLYDFAEVYTFLLVLFVVPLGFAAFYLFFSRHYGMFVRSEVAHPVERSQAVADGSH